MVKIVRNSVVILTFVLSFSFQLSSKNIIDSLETELHKETDFDKRLTLISDLIKNTLWEDVDQAKVYIDQYNKEAVDEGDSSEIARSYNFYGMWNLVQSNHSEAIKNYLKALPVYEELQDTFMVAMMYNNIGASHKHLNNFDETIDYFTKALQRFKSIHNQEWVSNLNYNIGLEYFDHGYYQKALDIFEEVKEDYLTRNELEFLPDCYESIGNCIFKLQGAKEALPYLLKALNYDHVRNNDLVVWQSLCACYTELGDYTEAEKYCSKAMSGLDKIPANTIRLEILNTTANLYKKTNRYKEATKLLDDIVVLKDSIYNSEKDEQYLAMIKKFESDKKDQELLMKDQILLQKEKQQKLYLISLVLAGMILLSALMFIIAKIRNTKKLKEKNEIIQSQLEEKNILMKEIHHRVKNNLQIISSLLNIQSREIDDKLAVEAINLSRNRVKSMALIHQNLYQKENITNIDAKVYIERLSKSIFNSYKIDQDHIQLQTDVDNLELDVDLTIPLGLIINELVTNSLKHAFPHQKNGKIEIVLKKMEKDLKLIVSDNGIGLLNDDDPKKKDSFGLRMIKIFAAKLKASYTIENDFGSKVTLIINDYQRVNLQST